MPGSLDERLGVVPIRIPGPGGTQMSYTLPQGVALEIQSIVAQIAPSGADVRPELVITEQEGYTIATRRQEDSVPAADTGEAAWSLGLSGG
jgi:hypothetical protein